MVPVDVDGQICHFCSQGFVPWQILVVLNMGNPIENPATNTMGASEYVFLRQIFLLFHNMYFSQFLGTSTFVNLARPSAKPVGPRLNSDDSLEILTLGQKRFFLNNVGGRFNRYFIGQYSENHFPPAAMF